MGAAAQLGQSWVEPLHVTDRSLDVRAGADVDDLVRLPGARGERLLDQHRDPVPGQLPDRLQVQFGWDRDDREIDRPGRQQLI